MGSKERTEILKTVLERLEKFGNLNLAPNFGRQKGPGFCPGEIYSQLDSSAHNIISNYGRIICQHHQWYVLLHRHHTTSVESQHYCKSVNVATWAQYRVLRHIHIPNLLYTATHVKGVEKNGNSDPFVRVSAFSLKSGKFSDVFQTHEVRDTRNPVVRS